MLINSEKNKKTGFQYEASEKQNSMQRKIKGCGRDIIKLPGFKEFLKEISYPLQCKFMYCLFCEECILMKRPKYRFPAPMNAMPSSQIKWLLPERWLMSSQRCQYWRQKRSSLEASTPQTCSALLQRTPTNFWTENYFFKGLLQSSTNSKTTDSERC